MFKRYQVRDEAKQEVSETFSPMLACCVLAQVTRRRGEHWFAPVGVDGPIESEAVPLFLDQVEEIH
jgi:hypothetical protein